MIQTSKLLDNGLARQILAFLGFLFVIHLMSIQYLAANDLPIIYLSLFTIYIFSPQEKLTLNVDWCVSIILIVIVAVAASSLSKFPEISFSRIIIYRDLFLLSFSIYLLFQKELINLSTPILLAIIFAFLIISPVTISEYFEFSKTTAVANKRYINPELSYFGHIRHYSYQAFLASCCALIVFFNLPRYRILLGSLCLLCISLLVLSTGRAAILCFGFFAFICTYKLYGRILALKIGLVCVLIIVTILTILHFSIYSSLVESIIKRSSQLSDINQLLSGRLSFWKGGLLSVMDSPLLGLGANGFRWSEGAIPNAVQPHSSLIQLIIEYGWLGGTVIFYRCWLFFAPLCKNLRSSTLSELHRTCLALFFLSYLLFSLVDGLIYHFPPMFHMAIIIPLLFANTLHDEQI